MQRLVCRPSGTRIIAPCSCGKGCTGKGHIHLVVLTRQGRGATLCARRLSLTSTMSNTLRAAAVGGPRRCPIGGVGRPPHRRTRAGLQPVGRSHAGGAHSDRDRALDACGRGERRAQLPGVGATIERSEPLDRADRTLEADVNRLATLTVGQSEPAGARASNCAKTPTRALVRASRAMRRRSEGLAPPVRRMPTPQRAGMDAARATMRAMRTEENRLLADRVQADQAAGRRLQQVTFALVAVAVGLLGWIGWLVLRTARRQRKTPMRFASAKNDLAVTGRCPSRGPPRIERAAAIDHRLGGRWHHRDRREGHHRGVQSRRRAAVRLPRVRSGGPQRQHADAVARSRATRRLSRRGISRRERPRSSASAAR